MRRRHTIREQKRLKVIYHKQIAYYISLRNIPTSSIQKQHLFAYDKHTVDA